jgi:exopolysaccharide biosynthesis predicted pyruvyltransferase EpsI
MRVAAILAAYNEERFIAGCLEHLFGQGVEAYLIDNGSTDRTVEIAERYLGRGLICIEDFPRAEGTYRWQPILRRKEELAATLEADWFMHADPDEIRLPPRSDLKLAEAFAEVDDKGYNAVNFVEFTFVPTREAPDHDHPDFARTMRHYYPFVRNFPHQVKAWKRQSQRIDLVRAGGHKVRFPDLRLYPESFKMRHYPYLSVPHVLSKYVEKKYDAEELRRGWHRYRARVEAKRIALPSQEDLHVYTSDDALDLSNPRARHLMEEWVPLEKAQLDRSVRVKKRLAAPPRVPLETERAATVNVGVGVLHEKIRGIVGNVLSARRGIAASRRKILRGVAGASDITFIRGQGNIGDHLIHAGTRRLLAGIPHKEVVVSRHKGDGREAGIRGLGGTRGHTALITGSGGWCGPFHALMPELLRLVERRFERVIVLPSTVDTSVEEVRGVLAETKALFFARERESYRQLQGLCETDIAHDCAMFFNFGPYKLRGEGLLTAFRTDADSNFDEPPPGNDDISLSCKSLDEWLWKIACHQAVETDRAHVMIAAAMLGKKVRYHATNYHKVPAIAQYSLKGFPVERMPEKSWQPKDRSYGSPPAEEGRSPAEDKRPVQGSRGPTKGGAPGRGGP